MLKTLLASRMHQAAEQRLHDIAQRVSPRELPLPVTKLRSVSPHELPLPVTKLRSIFHFWVGAHSLPVEQGRIEVPQGTASSATTFAQVHLLCHQCYRRRAPLCL